MGVLADTTAPTTGTATFQCSNGMWSLLQAPAPTCTGAAPPPPAGCLNWSDAATWGGAVPPANTLVDIPVGRCVVMDVNPPALAGLVIRGTLRFADTGPRALTARWIHVNGGALEVGSAAQPFQNDATITLNDTDTGANAAPGMGTRALLVSNGTLALHGRRPATAWTQLADHVAAGGSTLTLRQPMADWQSNDEIVVAPTDYYGVGITERRQLSANLNGGTTVQLSSGLSAPRWGRLQYPAPSDTAGLALAPPGNYLPPATPAPAALDQRAEVGNLTRGIVIQAPNDTLWQTQGFGAHTMVMGLTSRVTVDGVRFRRVGQAGLAGRYGFHWHMLSYVSGQPVGDAVGHVLQNSVITESRNRCITIHGTNGVTVRNNICHDIRGHAIFLEDAVERRNRIEGNLVLHVRGPLPGRALLNHDVPNATVRGGPSGMWITHPDNIIERNAVADIDGNGYWFAFPRQAIGHPDSLNPAIRPRFTPFGTFNDNVAHSVNLAGVMIDLPPVVSAPHGDVEDLGYYPTANTLPPSETNPIVPFALRRITTYKNREGIWNRVNGASYEEWASADNTSKYFIGSSALSHIRRSLVVGTSLNNASTWQTLVTNSGAPYAAYRAVRVVEPPAAFASYHGGVAMTGNTIVNFPYVNSTLFTATGSVPSGAFANDDYYLRPVERSLAQNASNLLIHSAPGRRSVPSFNNFVFAGAVVDYEGLFGTPGANWVYDTPFLTAGGGCVVVAPAGSNGASCTGQYFGAEAFVLDRNNDESYPLMAIDVSRRDPSNLATELGRWSVNAVAPAAAPSTLLPNMRHFAMREAGVFVLAFPGYHHASSVLANAQGPLRDVRMTIGNMHSASDTVVLAVEFHGSQANVFATTFPNYASMAHTGPLTPGHLAAVPAGSTRVYTPRNSLADLLQQGGDAYFHDVGAARVWMKLRGGLVDAYVADPSAFSDETLYRPFFLRITQ